MRDIPPPATKKPILLSTREEYIEWLKTLEFTDAYGKLVEPDYEALAPPLEELPMLIIWTTELQEPQPIIRSICLN